MVLCHQNFDHTKTQQPDVWHFDGTSSDNRCGVYVFKEKTTKSIRPKQTRYWEYPDRDGSRLVRVERVDDGFGNKKVRQQHWDKNKKDWVYGWGDVVRASIPIYRRAEVREAIAKGETVYIVEGEPCADLLWKLGLAATTNIGGGTKFTLTDSMDLQGAKVIVIVPDRDKKGIEHAEKVAEYFPHALWLYPFPESKFWENLPTAR
jgi:5S rRNA maturation endonuclease (ribonuclease M5)